jgi:hypothetical protein
MKQTPARLMTTCPSRKVIQLKSLTVLLHAGASATQMEDSDVCAFSCFARGLD